MAEVVDADLQERTAAVIGQLRKVADMIDDLWRDTLEAGVSDTEIPLGEASQAVQRALVALSSQEPPTSPLRRSWPSSGNSRLACVGLAPRSRCERD
jgi:hypothetical protein